MKTSGISVKINKRKIDLTVQKIIGLAIALHGLGMFLIFLRKHHTNFGNYMFMVLEVDHAKAFAIERVTVSIFLILCFIILIYRRVFLLLPIFVYIFLEAWMGYIQGGYHFSEFTMGAHALRYLAPVALLVLVLPDNVSLHLNRQKISSWILRIGLAVVFITHGVECLQQNPRFIDLLIGSSYNLLGEYIPEEVALHIMTIIGWVDVLVALLVLLKPHKTLLMWLCFWATITAFSRMTSFGSGAYTEVLLRASHILAPVALWLLLSELERQRKYFNHFVPSRSKQFLYDSK